MTRTQPELTDGARDIAAPDGMARQWLMRTLRTLPAALWAWADDAPDIAAELRDAAEAIQRALTRVDGAR